ncbi:histidine kinase [Sinorhizobium numidicum]|uniref:histidine kinase n=1 Tax=Sinorhizobium numidicum TaxID=680248 RepID=A0ABY8CWY9_9HYPH|nr:histidine kinase [Sinorhizobium numidicum]WEX75258.1 histidine kinase [Sinorhizobium numidicum]WEX81253.1 histidine kinase [Sinorhizobium numidicum]
MGLARDRLLSTDPERLICIGRLVTAVFAMLAIYLDPTRPNSLLHESRVVLGLYLFLSLVLVLRPLRKPLDHPVHLITHVVDAGVVGWLTFLTNELASPFFTVLPFVILAMTMRWGLKGATLGALIALFVQLIVGLPDLLDGESELDIFIMRSTYFVLAAVTLGYFGAYRERSRQRLTQLAGFPFDAISGSRVAWLDLLFKHASRVLGDSRLIVVWRDQEEDAGCVAHWMDGELQLIDIRNTDFWARHDLQPSHRRGDHNFIRKSEEQLAALMADLPEITVSADQPVRHLSSAAFSSVGYRGRVFVINSAFRPDEGDALTEIIATRFGSELERHSLIQQTTEAARSEERMRLARDLHDGVLQNLTAARLKLKLLSGTVKDDAKLQISEVGLLILEQQQRVRQFVEDNRTSDEPAHTRLDQSLSDFLELLREQWNCRIEISFSPPDLAVPTRVVHEIMQLISEAVANAVRHGRATGLSISVIDNGNGLEMKLIDNGAGIAPNAKLQTPLSLSARVAKLGGDLAICRTTPGFGIHIKLPIMPESR